ncbi:thrombomodulin-like [Limanda limanda]|uniref:thrombomodulin-like n=1 Tax=Limanda limanda TaxID=27771 RepID=UPI0029C65D81|nr:thrombomodulin-like [Limanda limanda]
MSPTTQALLICVVFLCGLADAVLALHGHCADNRCFVLLRESQDFPGARTSCRDTEGQLLAISSEQAEETLAGPLSGHSGSFWLELQGTGRKPEEAPADLGNCSSVSVSGKGNILVSGKRCRNVLDGFLCQYTFQEPCSRIKPDGGAQVRYTTHMGFDVNESEVFPPATTAVADKVGGKHLDSKHLCFSGGWMRAPWSCEVFKGGCEHSCNQTTRTCTCPEGRALHPNGITCAQVPSDVSPLPVLSCPGGHKPAQDGRSCVDVDECTEGGEDPCTAEGQECVNTDRGFECRCRGGFDMEDGACVDVAICSKCEHMRCVKPTGVYECACRKGFRVSDQDTTKCERHCTERDCEAVCTEVGDVQDPEMRHCECPEGYIRDGGVLCTDINECDTEGQCDHKCDNVFGGFRCSCYEGFRLQGDSTCVPTEEVEGESGDLPPSLIPATAHPAAVPSYIRTGSVLGITVFMALCAALLCLLVHTVVKRCGRFELSSFRRPDIDVFYLQQVTTDTYKRLSFDKQFKSDVQRL